MNRAIYALRFSAFEAVVGMSVRLVPEGVTAGRGSLRLPIRSSMKHRTTETLLPARRVMSEKGAS